LSPTNGDITTEEAFIGKVDLNDVLTMDVENLIARHSDFALSDVLEVVHLIDTDGLYIPENRICQKTTSSKGALSDEDRRPLYLDHSIEVLDVEAERKTLENKRFAVRDLLEKKTLVFPHGIEKPYSIFYNSCNLEHALHNQRNVPWRSKRPLANAFADLYFEDDEKFITLFDELNQSRSWDYQTTWSYLKKGDRSLARSSNFLLYLNRINPDLVQRFVRWTR
jgi:hypothetical protein